MTRPDLVGVILELSNFNYFKWSAHALIQTQTIEHCVHVAGRIRLSALALEQWPWLRWHDRATLYETYRKKAR